ncbi:unnamed protein product [Phaedon cochleariae]|uniref:Insulin receptor substrate 1 n=1 Tax=Phaedon cochleariae TaxID=80249 RepID=A0A9N9SLM4_PHACE|nr:unnamed protein product [Phaedon cochleariae]
MEQEEPIHQGILLIPPVGKLLKKSWQQKYCLLFKASKFGVERLEVYDTVDSKECKIITLEDCIKVQSKTTTILGITTRISSYEFGALHEQSMNQWLSAIQSVAFPDEISKIGSIEEDNDLYCSSGEGVFNVKLHPSPVSQRCCLESKNYTLVLTSAALQLKNIVDGKLLFTWPYCFIRRYGYKSGKFTFEAGRKCESGEGTFFLEHPNQQEIFRCLATKMKSMRKLLSGESSPPILDCGDAQLHAALSMEARSRTPLPPSPTVPSASITDSPISTISTKSQLGLNKPKPEAKPALKLKPAKPPRKFVTAPKLSPEPEDFAYEPVTRKYDEVEIRNNAWQTLGIESPNHMEQITEDEEQNYMSWGEVRRGIEAVKQPLAPSIIPQNVPTENDSAQYDKLNFFGSSSKLNFNSPYKQVFPIPVNPVEPPSYNEYDEVQCLQNEISVEDKRKADVAHHFHNEEPYAVISKPKRV